MRTRFCLGLFVAFVASCGGAPTGRVRVDLVASAPPHVTAFEIEVSSLALHGAGVTSAPVDQVLDLVALGRRGATLADVDVPAGHYDAVTLRLGDRNAIVDRDGNRHRLILPGPSGRDVIISIPFEVTANAGTDLALDWDPLRSVFVDGERFTLQPSLGAHDRASTGFIAGTILSDAAELLPGTTIHAERLTADGTPELVRTTRSNSDGTYVLDLLPLGARYWLVTEPSTDVGLYYPHASDGIYLSEYEPSAKWSVTLTPASSSAAVAGAVVPAATDHQLDVVQLMRRLSSDGDDHEFVVAGTVAGRSLDNKKETFALDRMPPGSYSIGVLRLERTDGGVALRQTLYPRLYELSLEGGTIATVELTM